jgi:hypothetical protein
MRSVKTSGLVAVSRLDRLSRSRPTMKWVKKEGVLGVRLVSFLYLRRVHPPQSPFTRPARTFPREATTRRASLYSS